MPITPYGVCLTSIGFGYRLTSLCECIQRVLVICREF